jgi:hypothetical protein
MTYMVRGVEVDIRRTGTGEAVRVVFRSEGQRLGPYYYMSERQARDAIAAATDYAIALRYPVSHKLGHGVAWGLIITAAAVCLWVAALLPFMLLVALSVFLFYLW